MLLPGCVCHALRSGRLRVTALDNDGARLAREIDTPLVSTFIPTHNGAEFIGQTIESVLNQTYDTLELIVVDDCSSDETVGLVEGYARRDSRVKLVAKSTREGPCRARNVALAQARGSLLCWMDQDDIWQSEKVREQVDFLSERPNVGLVYSYFDAFDSGTGEPVQWPEGRRDFEGDVLTPLFLIGCFIGSITTMFRRDVFGDAFPRLREQHFSYGDDYYLWLAIALSWQVARIPKALASYRRHMSNESARLVAQTNVELARANLLCDFLREFPAAGKRLGDLSREVPAYHLLRAARYELERGKRLRATLLTARAARHAPSIPARTRFGTYIPPHVHAWYRANGLWSTAGE